MVWNNTDMKFVHYLEGRWQLSRKIDGSHSALVKGLALFIPSIQLDELYYSEEIQMILSTGKTLKGYQKYFYRFENNSLNVYFNDGKRLFHSIDAKLKFNQKYTANHDCLQDTYMTSYFFNDNSFEIEHRVNGPKKSYISQSTYTRYFK